MILSLLSPAVRMDAKKEEFTQGSLSLLFLLGGRSFIISLRLHPPFLFSYRWQKKTHRLLLTIVYQTIEGERESCKEEMYKKFWPEGYSSISLPILSVYVWGYNCHCSRREKEERKENNWPTLTISLSSFPFTAAIEYTHTVATMNYASLSRPSIYSLLLNIFKSQSVATSFVVSLRDSLSLPFIFVAFETSGPCNVMITNERVQKIQKQWIEFLSIWYWMCGQIIIIVTTNVHHDDDDEEWEACPLKKVPDDALQLNSLMRAPLISSTLISLCYEKWRENRFKESLTCSWR